jgi:hypothetical protein
MSLALWKGYQRTLALSAKTKRRGETPAAKAVSQREWKQHTESMLALFEQGYDSGNQRALWDAIIFCNDTSTPQPMWVREVLVGLINGRQPKKSKGGRPHDWLQDFIIYDSVNRWREERRGFGKGKKTKNFSYNEAYEEVRKELGWHEDSNGTIRAAYKRARKAKSMPNAYYVSPSQE